MNSATETTTAIGVKWRFLGNLVQKMASFLLNQLLIQYTNPEILGTAAIQLELLLASILFLSREGIRLAVLRTPIHSKQDFHKVVNISWIPCLLIFIFIIGYTINIRYLSMTNGIDKNVINDLSTTSGITILLYSLGAFFEACGEPWLNIYQHNLLFTPRVSAEVVAVFIRSSVTFIAVAIYGMGVNGFGIAQLMHGLAFILVLLYHSFSAPVIIKKSSDDTNNDNNNSDAVLIQHPLDFLPSFIYHTNVIATTNATTNKYDDTTAKPAVTTDCCSSVSVISADTALMACTLTASSLFKHILTEADKIVLSLFFSVYDQGIFAFANNYGSLIARLVFLPIEETCRITYSSSMNQLKDDYAAYQTYHRLRGEVNNESRLESTASTTSSTVTAAASAAAVTRTPVTPTKGTQKHMLSSSSSSSAAAAAVCIKRTGSTPVAVYNDDSSEEGDYDHHARISTTVSASVSTNINAINRDSDKDKGKDRDKDHMSEVNSDSSGDNSCIHSDDDSDTPRTTTTTTNSNTNNADTLTLYRRGFSQHMSDLFTIVSIIQMVGFFGLIILIFGPFNVRLLLTLVPFNERWRTEEVVSTLAYYCLYIFILGVNGVSEGFVQSVIPTRLFYTVNVSYVVSTLIYAKFLHSLYYYTYTAGSGTDSGDSGETAAGTGLGASVLVLASALSMAVRVVFNMAVMQCFFAHPVWFIAEPAPAGSDSHTSQSTSTDYSTASVTTTTSTSADGSVLLVPAVELTNPVSRLAPSLSVLCTALGMSTALYYSSINYYNYLHTFASENNIKMSEITIIRIIKLALKNGSKYQQLSAAPVNGLVSKMVFKVTVIAVACYPLLLHIGINIILFCLFLSISYMQCSDSMKQKIFSKLPRVSKRIVPEVPVSPLATNNKKKRE